MRKQVLFASLLLALISSGCAGNGDDGVAGPSGAGGSTLSTVRVNLTDKPAEQYLAVNVTIVAVRVHQSASVGELEAGWSELPVTAEMPVDLLQLRNGVLLKLCETQLPVGHYQQVRLVLEPNVGADAPFNQSVVTADGETHALEVPSGSIKIVHGFVVEEPQATELTLDFDAARSVKKRGDGTFYMKPVITAASSKTD